MSYPAKVDFKKPATLPPDEFELLRQLIFDLSGINLQDHKKELLRARLLRRLASLGLKSFRQYYKLLISEDNEGKEKVQLLNAISTNKTEFLREPAHFEFLTRKAFPSLEGQGIIRILCAGCSTGEEAYTIAMTACNYFDKKASVKVAIYACDINTQVLEHAKNGVYSIEVVGSLPKPKLHRFFLQGTQELAGFVKVTPELQNLVDFQHHNLMDPLPYKIPFHIVFCRNVVIYFNRDTQTKLLQRLFNSLVPEGYLVMGHSESMAFSSFPYVMFSRRFTRNSDKG